MDQDILIVTGGAILAAALLIAGLAWEVRRWRRGPDPTPIIQPRPAASPPAPRSVDGLPKARRGPLHVLRDVIDVSIGMYLFRRLLGRSTTPRSRAAQASPTFLEGGVGATRGGAVTPAGPVVRRPTRIVVAGAAADSAAVGAPVRPPSPGLDRRRFYRDTFMAIVGIAAVFLFAVVILPSLGSGQGQVLGETGTPESSAGVVIMATVSPSLSDGVVAIPTPVPVSSEGSGHTPSGEPLATATSPSGSIRAPTLRPTAAPTATPVATPTPTPNPTL
jgi:hypothetical protein